MKAPKRSLITFLAVGIVITFSSVSFADGDRGDMKVLKEAASALEQTHPDLSSSLTKIVEREEQEHKKEGAREEQMIKLYQDAAAALGETQPILAEGLTKLVNEEIQESTEDEEEVGEKEELEGKADKEMKERSVAKLKLLKDSAEALQESHPALAEGLTKIVNRKTKWMGTKVTAEQAKTIAQKSVNLEEVGAITDVDLENENGIFVYSVQFTKDDIETDVKINAETGKVVKIESDKDEMGEEEEER